MSALLEKSEVSGLTLLRRGKVRDVYDLGDKLLIVATDRLSAFDYILPTPIAGKGEILTRMSAWWFNETQAIIPNHLISADFAEIQKAMPRGAVLPKNFSGRAILARKARRIDAECVVRGYLAGSAFKEYKKTGAVCGRALPKSLLEAAKLPEPIFTPATKADQGHDENISRERLAELVGADVARRLEEASLKIYRHAAALLETRGLILADTKFEFGWVGDELILIDEILTPDSSRLWDAAAYAPGRSPESFDKQYVRDFLETSGWDKNSPPPALPKEVVAGTLARYQEAWRRLSNRS